MKFALLLFLSVPCFSQVVRQNGVNGGAVTYSSVTVNSLPANSVVYTTAGGQLAAVSTFSFTGAGNVGINTASPLTTLDVNGKSTFRDAMTVAVGSITVIATTADSFNGYGNVRANNNGTNGSGVYIGPTGNEASLLYNTNGNLDIAPRIGFNLTIAKSGGSVGFGNSNPYSLITASSGTLALNGNGAKIEVSSGSASAVLSSCGTAPLTAGADLGITDIAGRFQVGTSPGTGCVITFQTAYTNRPICFCQDESASGIVCTASPAAGGASVTLQGVFVSANIIDYWCVGRR